MAASDEADLVALLRKEVSPLRGDTGDFDAILELVGEKHFVLLGEASHGTHEFYRLRAELTKRLIRDKGFSAVAVEADWPDAYRVNRYAVGLGQDLEASEALADFRRFLCQPEIERDTTRYHNSKRSN